MHTDSIQPFQLDVSQLRGRAVRMESVIQEILGAHDYPEPVAHLVGETVLLTVLLSSMLKFEGKFSLQIKGDGPVSMLFADMTSDGVVRACSTYNEERLNAAREKLSALRTTEASQNHLAQYLGKGYIAFTVEQKGGQDDYQGIVELRGSSLTDCVQHYFTQSEQINTGIKMAVGRRDGRWRGTALMLQHMPSEGGMRSESVSGNLDEDDWRRSMVLMDSVTEDELLDPALSVNDLLFRLFHEEQVRVFEPASVEKGCRCSEEKVEQVINLLPDDDLVYLVKDGQVTMRCEFCSHDYKFDLSDIQKKRLKKARKAGKKLVKKHRAGKD